MAAAVSPEDQTSLGDLARTFLRLGTIAFGGPAAHIGLMREELVRRRGWLTDAEYLDLVGASALIPGPNSTEVAIHIGAARAGWRGLLVAGAAFILPAVVIVLAVAWAYVRYGTLPEVRWLLYGIAPVIVAIVAVALWGLTRTAVKGPLTGAVGAAVLALALVGVNELALLGTAAVVMLGVRVVRPPPPAPPPLRGRGEPNPASPSNSPRGVDGAPNPDVGTPLPRSGSERRRRGAGGGGGKPHFRSLAWPLISILAATAAVDVNLWRLFWFFLRTGSVLFGSGYVLLAFLRADLVERWGWLTDQQLLDAVAVGQFTPGPVFTTATFIGYVVGGWSGAVVATLGIFIPAFFFVWLTHPLIAKLRGSRTLSALLDGVNVASLGLMAAVTWQLGRAALTDAVTWLLAAAALVLLVRVKPNAAWLVLGGGAAGFLWKWAGG